MRICVYGAASPTVSKDYILKTEELGREIGKRGHDLVYGAGANGLMGAVARGCHEAGSHIIGVAPEFFNVDGILYPECNQLIRPKTMRERKQIMEDSADAFITVPGGIGTFEEFFEVLTLKQLKQLNKPIAIYNINGYYDALSHFMDNAIKGNFVKEGCLNLFKICSSIEEIFDYIDNFVPVEYDVLELREIR